MDDAFNLKGLVTVKDIQKQTEFPLCAKMRRDDCGLPPQSGPVGTLRKSAAIHLRQGGCDRGRYCPWPLAGFSIGCGRLKSALEAGQVIAGNIATLESSQRSG